MPPAVASDLATLPAGDTWVNLRDLGAKGDGHTDDTDVLQKAIAAHRTIYLPSGFYVVHDTLTLRPDTVLIGLHPGATQIILPDGTPAYQGIGGPKAFAGNAPRRQQYCNRHRTLHGREQSARDRGSLEGWLRFDDE